MPEVPHRQYVSCLRYSGQSFVHHGGTNEYHQIRDQARMSFNEAGMAWLRHPVEDDDGEWRDTWVNDIFRFSFHQDDEDPSRLFVWDRVERVASWLHDKQHSFESKIVQVGGANLQANGEMATNKGRPLGLIESVQTGLFGLSGADFAKSSKSRPKVVRKSSLQAGWILFTTFR